MVWHSTSTKEQPVMSPRPGSMYEFYFNSEEGKWKPFTSLKTKEGEASDSAQSPSSHF